MSLSENELLLFENISKNKSDEVRKLLSTDSCRVNCLDKAGMTPLQHAAFKSNLSVCKLLISNGAEVNSHEHDKGYTTLMFAALSGNKQITQLVLEAGANTTRVNCVGRTASQMAAFVGQYHCVSLINNYFEKSELAYYTRTQGLETVAKLAGDLLEPLYRLVIRTNLNPVGYALFARDNSLLLSSYEPIGRVLALLCEKSMKRADANHILAVKFHFLSELVIYCGKARDNFKRCVTGLLASNEKFIRSTFSSFPYMECPIIQQIIRTIYNVKIGEEPTALAVLSSSINGQRYLGEDEVECVVCGAASKLHKKCSKCKMVSYCDKDCQKMHWSAHKSECASLTVVYLDMEKQRKLQEQADKLAKQAKEEEAAKESQVEVQREIEAAPHKEDGSMLNCDDIKLKLSEPNPKPTAQVS